MLMIRYLIIPSSNTHTCAEEIQHISTWASQNNLKLNQSKSTETIFTRALQIIKDRNVLTLPPEQTGILRTSSINILGVTIQNNFKLKDHVTQKISDCSKSLYAIKTLKAHGLPSA